MTEVNISNTIKNRYYRYSSIAIEHSKKSDMSMKHVSIAVKKGRIVAIGYNERRNTYKGFNCFISTHSEIKCCMKLDTDKECDIYVYRVNNNDDLKNTKPCNMCIWYMKRTGIKNVIYFDGEDVIKANIQSKDMKSYDTSILLKNKNLLTNHGYMLM